MFFFNVRKVLLISMYKSPSKGYYTKELLEIVHQGCTCLNVPLCSLTLCLSIILHYKFLHFGVKD